MCNCGHLQPAAWVTPFVKTHQQQRTRLGPAVAISRRISSTSATRLLPPDVGAQYTRLERSPHSSAAACQGYMRRTFRSSYACKLCVLVHHGRGVSVTDVDTIGGNR